MLLITGDTWDIGNVSLQDSTGAAESFVETDVIRAAFRNVDRLMAGPITIAYDAQWINGIVNIVFPPSTTKATIATGYTQLPMVLEIEVKRGGVVSTWLSADNLFYAKKDVIT